MSPGRVTPWGWGRKLSPFADDGSLLAVIVDVGNPARIRRQLSAATRAERCDDGRDAPRAALRSAADRLIFNAREGFARREIKRAAKRRRGIFPLVATMRSRDVRCLALTSTAHDRGSLFRNSECKETGLTDLVEVSRAPVDHPLGYS